MKLQPSKIVVHSEQGFQATTRGLPGTTRVAHVRNYTTSRLRFASSVTAIGLVFVVLGVFTGCNDAPGNATVNGFVTLDGKPLKRGIITFACVRDEPGAPASGQVQTNGSYQVQIGNSGAVVAGEYVVTVCARAPSIDSPTGGPPTPGPLITPVRYSTPDLSGLRYHIRPGANVIDIALSTPVEGKAFDAETALEMDDGAQSQTTNESKMGTAGQPESDQSAADTTSQGPYENGEAGPDHGDESAESGVH